MPIGVDRLLQFFCFLRDSYPLLSGPKRRKVKSYMKNLEHLKSVLNLQSAAGAPTGKVASESHAFGNLKAWDDTSLDWFSAFAGHPSQPGLLPPRFSKLCSAGLAASAFFSERTLASNPLIIVPVEAGLWIPGVLDRAGGMEFHQLPGDAVRFGQIGWREFTRSWFLHLCWRFRRRGWACFGSATAFPGQWLAMSILRTV
jgi:hypothetical protein